MRRFHAPEQNISSTDVTLGHEETRHLRDVLRLKIGDEANIFDGVGNEYRCTIATIGKTEARLEIDTVVEPSAPESPIALTLAVCQLPSDKFELVVQKSVELGVTRLVPLDSTRTDRQNTMGTKRLQRWRAIALSAAKQCGRATLMTVQEPVSFEDFAAELSTKDDAVYFFTERDGKSLPPEPSGKKITALVGPKGGWDDAEIELARDMGFAVVTFGGRILRAETASIAIAAIIQHRFGDVN